jgi:hypothetical protein
MAPGSDSSKPIKKYPIASPEILLHQAREVKY